MNRIVNTFDNRNIDNDIYYCINYKRFAFIYRECDI